MPDRIPYQGNSTLSKEPRATTLNFCPAVSGGTLPEFSSVRKLGRARKSRSLDVPAFFPWALVPCASLFLSELLSDGDGGEAGGCASCALAAESFSCPGTAGVAEVSDSGAEGAGFAGGGVCCATDGKERKVASTKAINVVVAGFIGKHLSPNQNP